MSGGGARNWRGTDITATWALVGAAVLRFALLLSEEKKPSKYPRACLLLTCGATKHVASPRRGRGRSRPSSPEPPSSAGGVRRAFSRPPGPGPAPGRRRRRILLPAPRRRAGMPRAPPVLLPPLLRRHRGGGGGAARAEAARDDAAALRLPPRQRPRAPRARPLLSYLPGSVSRRLATDFVCFCDWLSLSSTVPDSPGTSRGDGGYGKEPAAGAWQCIAWHRCAVNCCVHFSCPRRAMQHR